MWCDGQEFPVRKNQRNMAPEHLTSQLQIALLSNNSPAKPCNVLLLQKEAWPSFEPIGHCPRLGKAFLS